MLQYKKCSSCRKAKPIVEFFSNAGKLDGLRHNCKTCHYTSALRYRQNRLEYYAHLARENYHQIQDEAGCHIKPRDFYPAYRFLKGLETAEIVEVK